MTERVVRTAMVLGAGLGTRMRPLTDTQPKPMVKVGGKALVDWVLDDLSEAGIETAVVNVHYKADLLSAHVAKRTNPAVVISDETAKLLDTGGGVAAALSLFDDDILLVTNSDALWAGGLAPAIAAMTKAWSAETMDSLLLLAPMTKAHHFDGAGDFFVSGDGTPERRGSRDTAPYVYAGTQLVHRRLFDGCPEGAFSFNVLWDDALQRNRLNAVVHDADWYHVGTPDAVAPTAQALAGDTASS